MRKILLLVATLVIVIALTFEFSYVRVNGPLVVLQTPSVTIFGHSLLTSRIYAMGREGILTISSKSNDSALQQTLLLVTSSRSKQNSMVPNQPAAIYFSEASRTRNLWSPKVGGVYAYDIATNDVIVIAQPRDFEVDTQTEVSISCSDYSSLEDRFILCGPPYNGELLNDIAVTTKAVNSHDSQSHFYVAYDAKKTSPLNHQYRFIDYTGTVYKGKRLRSIQFAGTPDSIVGIFNVWANDSRIAFPYSLAESRVIVSQTRKGESSQLRKASNNRWSAY